MTSSSATTTLSTATTILSYIYYDKMSLLTMGESYRGTIENITTYVSI
jgi:hypothetical protein